MFDTSKVKTTLKEVTPEFAKKILDHTEKNIQAGTFRQRPISPVTVDRYARDIQLGAWIASPQTISIDVNGNALDGRHRLSAVVQSGVPVMMNVSTGWPPAQGNGHVHTIDIIDRGRVRNVGQNLVVGHGYTSGNYYAAVAKGIAEICCDGKAVISVPQALMILETYKDSAQIIYDIAPGARKRVSYVCAPLAFHHRASPAKVEEFAVKLFSMEDLHRGHPALTLLKWLANHKGGASDQRLDVAKVVFSCLRSFEDGESLAKVYASQDAWRYITAKQKDNVRKVRQILGVK
jgi:hypothetical protein